MNLIKFSKNQDFEKLVETNTEWIKLKDFRSYDIKKLLIVLSDMMAKLKLVRPEFSYQISIKNAESSYAGGFSNKIDKIILDMSIGKFINKIELEYPRLEHENTFILNGSIYIPILFLERAPIDRVGAQTQKKNKILLNFLVQQIVFDFKAKTVKFNKRISLDINIFFKALFYDEGYSEFMQTFYSEFGRPCINDRELTLEECKTKTLESLGINGHNKFREMEIDEFFDNCIMLNYIKEMYQDYYGVDNFKDAVRVVWEYYKHDTEIDMSDIRNRRLVMAEYLINPVFELYNKMVYGFVDTEYKEYLIPKLQSNVLIAEGFRKLMHGEQLFNIALPYITPIVHKISQNIVVITEKKIPKKWTSNHKSAMGVLCPISVSAQDMGSNLVATMNTRVNFYGRIFTPNIPHRDDLMFKLPEVILDGRKPEGSNETFGNFIVNSETGEIVSEVSDIEKVDK